MGTTDFDINNIVTWWGCVPEPEQRAIVSLAELAQTPAQTVPVQTVQDTIQAFGGVPAEKRTELLLALPGFTVFDESNPLCGSGGDCVSLPLSFYLGAVWACRLLGGCQIGSPVEVPCYYALTAPAS